MFSRGVYYYCLFCIRQWVELIELDNKKLLTSTDLLQAKVLRKISWSEPRKKWYTEQKCFKLFNSYFASYS